VNSTNFAFDVGSHCLIGQREADPRNYHRPALDAPMAVDALLERLPFQDVLEIHRALLGALAVDGHGPRRGLEVARELGRLILVSTELVVVVVCGDVFPLVRLLVGAE
jgi:hypothetical protein